MRQYQFTITPEGCITNIEGCTIKAVNLSSLDRGEYWQAWVNGVQDEGLTRNESILNAYNRFRNTSFKLKEGNKLC